MRVLVTGAGGQVGRALVSTSGHHEVVAYGHADLDIADRGAVLARFDADRPDVVINAAAYTAVDRAESEPELAHRINAGAVGHLATAASRVGARLVHISTDFVFDGIATRPYRPDDEPNPLSVYGTSKLAGEQAALAADGVVVRTSRVHAFPGHNFVVTMLELMASRDEVRVVDDQVGAPTWAGSLATAIWAVASDADARGIWHWSDAGSCSWFEWAVEIQRMAIERGLLERSVPVVSVPTDEFLTPASRPRYSVLDSSDTVTRFRLVQVPWEDSLRAMLDQMVEATHTP